VASVTVTANGVAGGPYTVGATVSGVSTPANFSLTNTAVPLGPSAAYVDADTATQGNWMGMYGSNGYDVANGPQSPAGGNLSYGSYSMQGGVGYTWAQSTSGQTALEIDSQGDRTAAAWYNGASFNFNVNFTDTNTHQVALYAMDWDSKGRGETITITNASTGQVLDTRSIPNTNSASPSYTNTTSANFVSGSYLIWNISGHVTITVTSNAGPNAVVSGIFFDTVK
jgi:hypothetical protein